MRAERVPLNLNQLTLAEGSSVLDPVRARPVRSLSGPFCSLCCHIRIAEVTV